MIYEKGDIRYFAAALKKNYGITLDQYNQMVSDQKGRCAICDERETEERQGRIRRLSVDHDHHTGKVRGLLCSSCNKAIGYFRDNRTLLKRAMHYLEYNEGVT